MYKKVTRIIAMILVIAMVVTMMPVSRVRAEEIVRSDNFVFAIYDNGDAGVRTWIRQENETSVVIPSEINGHVVTGIENGAFASTYLKNVKIPNSVTRIGDSAFQNCINLENIELPDNVTIIGESAFSFCSSLESVELSNNLITIGDYAFQYCDKLNGLELPNRVTTIGNSAFKACSNLGGIELPNSVTTIGEYAFYECTNLQSIKLSDNMTNTGFYTFAYCSNLKNIEIPHSVTTIDDYSFRECSSLESIKFSDSVETIGEYAFYWCSSLKEIKFSEGLKTIKTGAFQYCDSLESVEMQNKVKKIEVVAFAGCTNLKNIIWSNNLEVIEEAAFEFCAMKEVKLPNSVIEIKGGAFADCTSLTDFRVPRKVKDMTYVLDSCTALTNITVDDESKFLCSVDGNLYDYSKTVLVQYCIGKPDSTFIVPKGVLTIGVKAFYKANQLKELTIPKKVNDMQWSSIPQQVTIRGYTPSAAEIYAKDNGNKFISLGVNKQFDKAEVVYKNAINFKLCDKSLITTTNVFGNEADWYLWKLNGVNITYEKGNDYIYASNKVIGYENFNSEMNFHKTNYKDYIIPTSVLASWKANGKSAADVLMDKDAKDGKPYVSTVFARASSDDVSREYVEVQTSKLELIKGESYDVIISAGRTDAGTRYYLSQDDTHFISNATGKFSSEDLYNKFNKNYAVYAYVKNLDGKVSDPVEVKLEKIELDSNVDELLHSSAFSILGPNENVIKISEKVPLVGGAELNMEDIKYPIGIDFDGRKVKFTFGVDLFEKELRETPLPDLEKEKMDWESVKKSFRLLSTAKDELEDTDEIMELFRGFKEDQLNWGRRKISRKDTELEIELLGYAEAQITENGLVFTDVCGSVAAEFAFQYTQQGAIWVVPAYFYIKAGAKACFDFNMAKVVPDSNVPFNFGFNLSVEPSLGIGGGAGVEGAVSAGLYGSGSLLFENNFATTHRKVQLKGEFGVEGEFFILQGNKALLSGTTTIYDGYYKKANSMAKTAKVNSMNSLASTNDSQDTEVSLLSRDYLDNMSNWLGAKPKLRTSRTANAAQTAINVTNLQTSVYKNSQCQLVSFGDKMLMSWIEDSSERDSYNRMRLVYSVYDPAVGEWSIPKAVSDNGHLDSAPSLASDGENVYIAWQNIDTTLSDANDDTVDTILSNAEIMFAKYDVATDEFIEVKKLTNNESYDYLPSVSVENGVAVVYWANNTSNDFASGDNKIIKNVFGGENETVYTGLNYIAGIDSTNDKVTYTMDSDGDTTTANDIEIYTNGQKVTTEDGQAASGLNFTYGMFEGNNTLFYADETDIHYIDNGEIKDIFEEKHGVHGNLQAIKAGNSTILMWSELTEEGSEIFTCEYENGSWSQPIQLSKMKAMVSNLSAVYYNDAVKAVFNKTERIKNTNTEGETYYENGQTDLCQLESRGFTDLGVSMLYMDESTFVRGGNTEFSVLVENHGTETINNVWFEISDTLGNTTVIEKDINLAAGKQDTIVLNYAVPEEFGKTALTVEGDVTDAVDINDSNNTASYDIGYSDISVGSLNVEQIGDLYKITGIVENNNCIEAKDVSVDVYFGEEDSDDSTTINIGTMGANEKYSISVLVDGTGVVFEDSAYMIYFDAKTSGEELNNRNNKDSIAITEYHIHDMVDSVTPATVAEDGKIVSECSGCDEKTETVIPAVGNVNVSTSEYLYTGKDITPPIVKVEDREGNTISKEYYTVKYQNSAGQEISKLKAVGTYKAVVTFNGKYSGEKTVDFKVLNETSAVEINYFQISITSGGVRTIYSIEPVINELEVVERGVVYGVEGYVTESEMYVGSGNSNVIPYAATANGLLSGKLGTSPTADSYALTMKMGIGTASATASALKRIYYVRAYAKLSDGSYAYCPVKSYSIFSVAKQLYDNKLMNSQEDHDYLYKNILSIVDKNYPKVTWAHVHDIVETVVPATLTQDGKITKECSSCGVKTETVISAVDKIKLSVSEYVYTGKDITLPTVNVEDKKGNSISNEYYTVKYQNSAGQEISKLKDIGDYTAVVTFKGKYSGEKIINFKVLKETSAVEINYLQISTVSGGVRTIYSIESEINGLEVVERGIVYGIETYVTESEMYIGSGNSNVIPYAATANGLLPDKLGTSPTADSYAMTMKMGIGTASASALKRVYYARAYAKLSDGSYAYCPVESYSVYSIAKHLYDNRLMGSQEDHDYLYNNVLSIVDKNYPEVIFEPYNISAGKTAFASSDENQVFIPQNVLDGDPDTRWSSVAADEQWITIDLEDNCTVTSLKLDWEIAYAKNYTVYSSLDGETWTERGAYTSYIPGLRTHVFSTPYVARYIKIVGHTRATQYGISLFEVEVYGYN